MDPIAQLFKFRILAYLAGTAGVLLLFYVINLSYDVSLRDVQYFNGWVLVACFVGLCLLTLRKKTVVLPLGPVRKWLRLHIYLGLATIGVFVVHSKYRLPDAPIDFLLWGLFVIVAASGLIGSALNKIIPIRLEAHGEPILFERIPIYRAQLIQRVEKLVHKAMERGNALSIVEIYSKELASYFNNHNNIIAHLFSNGRSKKRMIGTLRSIERYLDSDGKQTLSELIELVEAKDNLDFYYVNGGALKVWPFFHISAVCALIIAIIVHVLIAYAFTSGIA